MRRVSESTHPHLLHLGIGDTTEPIPEIVSRAMQQKAAELATFEGYAGYGAESGPRDLREKIVSTLYRGSIAADEVFISDGAKCDINRLQLLFGSDVSIAVQDPTYPVYYDSALLMGQKNIHLLPCTPENDFFPDTNSLPPTDLLFFCNPNNPTGAVATREQLRALVNLAHREEMLIIYDAAYSGFIQHPSLPRSIYEIEGASEVAIEVSSFSKLVGFTGVRLGWTVVPKALRYKTKKSVHEDYRRVVTTTFNGPSNLASAGALAALSKEGLKAISRLTTHYLENAQLLKEALAHHDLKVYGGEHCPYLWFEAEGKKSWDLFEELLQQTGLITTPGSGFGPHGEGFIRLSAFAKRETILQATQRIREAWPKSLQPRLI